ncbi:MAG: FAD-dependent oxidoreductase [Candidatus Shapirobacteria bacterium]|jgi:protoporphyrinogen oxidase
MKKKVAIIGGGLGGLISGYLLSKQGYKVTILEKEFFLGGLISGFKMKKNNLEKTYHHFFKTDTDLIELIKEIGLQNRLKWYKNSTALYWKNKMYPFNGAIDLLKFKPLGFLDKFRMGLVAIYLKYDKNWKKYEKITANDWMKKMVGEQAYDVVWKPLLSGKFHQYYDKISMAWLWTRVNTRGNSKDKQGNEILGYINGGFEKIIERLAELIKKNNGIIKLNTEVKEIKDLEKNFDLVIDTRPAKNIDYLGMINVVFSTKQNLSKYYWHNINNPKSPFLVLIQHTNLIDKKKYNGKHIYYLGTYVPQNHKYFNWSDEKVEKEFLEYLPKIFKNFDKKEISEIKVFKFKYAQHIVNTNYKVPSYKISEKIWQLNFAQIYPQDRGMNFAVREAKKLVKEIIGA